MGGPNPGGSVASKTDTTPPVVPASAFTRISNSPRSISRPSPGANTNHPPAFVTRAGSHARQAAATPSAFAPALLISIAATRRFPTPPRAGPTGCAVYAKLEQVRPGCDLG